MATLSHPSRFALAAALMLATAMPLAAQTVRGRVADDSSGAAVTDVQVSLIDAEGREIGRGARSADDGSFRIHASGPGTYRLSARRIGYAPLTTSDVTVGIGELVTVEIRLTRAAQVIAPVRIVDRARVEMRELMTSDGFDLRRARSVGRFLGTEDMERLIATYGARATIGQLAETGATSMSMGLGVMEQIFRLDNRCTPHVYLDGFRATSGGVNFGDNAYARVSPIAASEVYGVEVYRAHEIPPASIGGLFGTEPPMDSKGVLPKGQTIDGYTMAPNTCGVIAVWTKGNMKQPGGLPGATEPALRGTLVHDLTKQPIAGAIVLLLTERGSIIRPATKSDDQGKFTVRIPTTGRFRLRAVHTKFDPVTSGTFQAGVGESIVVELRMAIEGQAPAALTIEQRTRAGAAPAPPAAPTPASGNIAPPPSA